MNHNKDIFRIKKSLESDVGKKVKLRAKKGRKKAVIRQGVIEKTYPNVFTIKIVNEDHSHRTVSFSYIDVLTKTVELALCEENQGASN